jgi:hypothetical protein
MMCIAAEEFGLLRIDNSFGDVVVLFGNLEIYRLKKGG